jgi:hypothetical protein
MKRENLTKPFSIEETERALNEMRTETTPEPDGFPVVFYKKF